MDIKNRLSLRSKLEVKSQGFIVRVHGELDAVAWSSKILTV